MGARFRVGTALALLVGSKVGSRNESPLALKRLRVFLDPERSSAVLFQEYC